MDRNWITTYPGDTLTVGEDDDRITVTADKERRELVFTCPGCSVRVSSQTPKCPFEMGGGCARHPVVQEAEDAVRDAHLAMQKNLAGDGI